MPVIEYKLHAINSQKHMQAPVWVTDGGHWRSPIDNTLVGWAPAEADREYYVPDTVTTLTKAELNTRLLAIHANTKYQKGQDVDNLQNMTNAEVTTMSDAWYDAYITDK